MFQIPLPKPVSAFSLAAMFVSIAGCASRGTVPTTFGQQPGASQQGLSNEASGARGGAFTGKYTATYSTRTHFCRFYHHYSRIAFSGFGHATFGLNHVRRGHMVLQGSCFSESSGHATLYGPTRTDSVIVDMRSSHWLWSWTVYAGTGTFLHATGGGTVIFHWRSRDSFTADWTGTLYY